MKNDQLSQSLVLAIRLTHWHQAFADVLMLLSVLVEQFEEELPNDAHLAADDLMLALLNELRPQVTAKEAAICARPYEQFWEAKLDETPSPTIGVAVP